MTDNAMKEKIIEAASIQLYGKMGGSRKRATNPGKKKSPFHLMETELYQRVTEHRSKGRKVSRLWITTRAKKILKEQDSKNGTFFYHKFKASRGWFHRFLKRRKIKFRKRKSGKKNSTDDNMDIILKWFTYLRQKVLPCCGNKEDPNFTEKHGRFPPHLRYNYDQVPLPFVVSQDETYTILEDTDVIIAGNGKGDLHKRQFTMHIVINAGEGAP
jgi:hypothetical protein